MTVHLYFSSVLCSFYVPDGKVRLQPFSPDNDNQLWIISGEKICKQKDPERVLDIKGAATKDGAKLLEYEWHGSDNQKWQFENIDS